ncbi:MAG: ABC transporter permease [Microbacteriaceae bacterium]
MTRPRMPRMRRGTGLAVGLVIVAVFLVAAGAAPLLAPSDPLAQDIPNALQPPGAAHWLGTDDLGRDVLSRLLYGARLDLLIGLGAAAAALLVGGAIGLLSGSLRGPADVALTRVMDVFQVTPGIVLVVMLLVVLGSSTGGMILALLAASWVAYARLVRAGALRESQRDYVLAARLAGLGHARILIRHVLPNVWLQAVVYATSDAVLAIGTVASLGYLGIGIAAPTPEWGAMIAAGQPYLQRAPWLVLVPGLTLTLLGLGLALVSDGITARRSRA